MHARDVQAVGGQGTRLIQAQGVHLGERLDGVALLHQHAAAGDAHRRERVGYRDGEEQPVGHQAGDDGRILDAVGEVRAREQRAGEQQDLDVGHDQQDRPDHEVDLALERRQDAAEGARAGRDLSGQALRADALGRIADAARDAEAAGIDERAGHLGDQVGLASELRLVHIHAPLADHPPVDHDLVAGADHEHVADDEVHGGGRALPAVADYRRLGACQQGDVVERALGTDLLDDAHEHVERDHAGRDEGIGRATEQDEREAEQGEAHVDEGEDVLADDLPVGAPGRWRRAVAQAARPPRPRLSLREAVDVRSRRGREDR